MLGRSFMIKGPRFKGRYPERWFEWQQALEPVFCDLINAQDTPFIDLAVMIDPLLKIAESAGWTADDVAAAVAELAVNYQIGQAAKRDADAAIARAIAARIRR